MESFNDLYYKLKENKIIKEMEEYAKVNSVPIINEQGLMFLLDKVYNYKVINILEVGCAIGYSASLMALLSGGIVDTIERNEDMYRQASIFIDKLGLKDKIRIHYADALELDLAKLEKEYDMIFIDAAKAQYQKFFLKYEGLLKKGGIIICDNLSFHNLTDGNLEDLSKNLRSMIKKINLFKDWLKDNEAYDTTIYSSIGDGLSISIKK